jgi:hypothetical protein
MNRKITLEQVKNELRARVCQHCPLRHPGRPGDRIDTSESLDCEATCELYEHLPKLTELARRVDPMIRSVDTVLQHKISQAIQSIHDARPGYDGRSSPLNRHRRCVVQTLTELVDK